MGEDGARGKDWLRAQGASPVSYRHNFLVQNLVQLKQPPETSKTRNGLSKVIRTHMPTGQKRVNSLTTRDENN